MDHFTKNLNAIRDRYPDLYKKLKRMKPPRDIKILKTPSGHPTAKWRVNGKWEYLHDPQNPREEADRFVFEEKKLSNPRLVVFLGFGLGYPIFSFLENRPQVNQYIIIVERELKFIWVAFHKFDLTPMLTREEILCLFGVEDQELFLKFTAIMEKGGLVRFAKAFEIIEAPASYKANKSYYTAAMQAFNQALRETLNSIGNDPKDSLIGLDNTLVNHRFYVEAPGINQLYGKFKDVPAIIVATGPSLNKNIDQLRGREEKALIISVDASLKPLLKHGITPHLVTSLERVSLVRKFFTRIPPEALERTYLVAIPLLTKDSLAAYKGEKIVALRAFAHYYWLDINKGILPIGPSAANMGFTIAEALGCNPIILVGQDLSYAPDGRTHAADNALGEKQEAILPERAETLWVKGNYTEKVLTTATWRMFLKNFEKLIEKYQGTCVNATEGGAYIPGTQVMTFRDASDRYLDRTVQAPEVIADTLKYPSLSEKRETYDKLIKVVEKGERDLKGFMKECEKWEEKIEKYLKNGKPQDKDGDLYPKNIQLIEEINAAKSKLTGHPAYWGIMYHIMQSFLIEKEIILNAVPPYNNPDPLKAQRGIIAEHIDWFRTNREIITRTRDILKKRLRGIRVRALALTEERHETA